MAVACGLVWRVTDHDHTSSVIIVKIKKHRQEKIFANSFSDVIIPSGRPSVHPAIQAGVSASHHGWHIAICMCSLPLHVALS